MKKTISLVLVFTFIFVLALQLPVLADDITGTATETPMLISANPEATSTATSTDANIPPRPEPRTGELRPTSTPPVKSTSTLERIPSPAHINLFEQIKKIGNDLFGIKKATNTTTQLTTSTPSAIEKKISDLKKAGLEKIASLDQTKLFDKITKIGKDLFGIKKSGINVLPTMTPEIVTCTSAAIDAKDTSISTALSTSASDITAAITARGTCQKTALALTSGVGDAIKVCNTTFQDAVKTANDKVKTTQKNTWDTYKTSLKTCSAGLNIEDGGDALK